MNITLELPDELAREAQQRAVTQSGSLSGWVAGLVRRELATEAVAETDEPKTWIEALTVPGMPDWFYEKDLPLPDRKATKHRAFTFEPDED